LEIWVLAVKIPNCEIRFVQTTGRPKNNRRRVRARTYTHTRPPARPPTHTHTHTQTHHRISFRTSIQDFVPHVLCCDRQK
jgi:hypothetical protein